MAKVKIDRGLQQNYNAIQEKDGDKIYVCTDSGNIYVGDTLVFEPNAYIDASINEKIVTFTTHGTHGTNGTDTLDLSMFQTGSEVAQAIAAALASIPEYTIERLAVAETGYSSSYILKKGNSQVGATINIPKDMVVSNGEVKTVTTANVPYQGAQVGDKYIDLTIANTSQNHIYIPVKDLVDVYVAGNGINISSNNYISVIVDPNNSNGLGVGGSGVSMYVVSPSINGVGGSNGAMLATDKEKLDGIEAGADENVIETVKVSGTALQVTDKAVNIETETAYDPTTNKIATMSDVAGATPNVGHLKTDNTTAQTPSASESFTGNISLHKVSKTGSYNDLNDKLVAGHDIEIVHVGNNLPEGYTELEYIESTGTQWIDTGVKFLFGDEFYFDFMPLSNSVSSENKGYGAGINIGTDNITGGGRINGGSMVMWVIGGNATLTPSIPSASRLNKRYIENWEITSGVLSGTLTEYETGIEHTFSASRTQFSSSYTSGNNLYLFRDNSTTYAFPSATRLYATWLKRLNGEFAFNLVPAKNSEDVVGLYDTVSNTFITNSGTGAFVAGTVKTIGEVINFVNDDGFITEADIDGNFVTSLGTSGNNVTWTKGGVTNNLTVPFATVASKLGTSTVGAANRPIYLNAGTPTVASVGESFLTWGGANFAASYGPIDAAMVSELGACRTMYAKAEGIVVEYSTDGGTTWLDYGATDIQKVGLFSVGQAFYTGKNSTNGGGSPNNMLRVTLRTSAASVYTILNKFVINVSTNGSTGCYCTIRIRTQQNYEDNVNTWETIADQVTVNGWSGYNVINTVERITYGNNKGYQYGEWQFIFGYTGFSGNYTGLCVYSILGFGGVGWATPSYMARTGHLYDYDALQNAVFPANITATKIIKYGGTSSQFLKADGSVDNNQYATVASLPDDSNLVHKTGNETIDGIKTFLQGVVVGENGIIDFLPTENAKNEITISNSTHDTNPQQSGGTTYIGVLQFDDADTGGYVRLRGVESPALGHDAVNKDYLESAIAVYINGQVGSGGVAQGNLFAFGFTDDPTEMQITQFVRGLPNQPNITLLPVTDYLFPIGCNIYLCPNFELLTPYSDVEEVMVYSSYQKVSLGNNAIYRGAVPLGTGEYSAVYLRVNIVDGKYWRPYSEVGETIEIIVSSNALVSGNFYIYLGRSVGSSEADPIFQLEDNNPLFYYDGTDLIEWSSYYSNSDLSDVVHKSGAETITGEKTFSANVNLDNNATLNFITDDETPDGVYVEASETSGNMELVFSSISSDSPVILGNIHYPINDLDAANKHYVDESIENIVGTKVFLNVHTGAYGVHPKSLAAFYTPDDGKTMNVTSFTTTGGNGSKEPVVGLNFPIGSKIYYYDGTTAMPSDFGITMKFYTSHKSVDARYSAIDGTNLNLGNHPTNTQSTVYLHVMVSNGYWSPFFKEGVTEEIIVSSNQIKAGGFYIYLGKTTGGSSSTNIIQLEDNNPLYYYDGYDLIDWASYIAEDSVAGTVQSITVGTTTTGEPGTNANVVNSGTPTNQILDFYIPRGADAVNPFKGWFASDTQLMAEYPNPSNGDYAYVQTQNGVLVYQASGGAWRGTTIVFNPSNNQEFASGESLNLVSIINDLVTGGASNVLSAQQGVVLNTLISNLQTLVNNLSQQMPVLEKKTAQEIQILIDTGTWTQGTLYYSVEED